MLPPERHDTAVLSADTSGEAERLQVRIWRSLASADTARVIAGACRTVREVALAGLRERHPEASDAELVTRLAAITLGPALARQVYSDVDMLFHSESGDLIRVTLVVTAALEASGVRYTVGGSLASSFSGEPRASVDADILMEMRADQVELFLAVLGNQFYADPDSLRRAISSGSSTNLVHRPTGIKVDLFAASSVLDAQQLDRRRQVQIASGPDRFIFIHSPEDILLQKLHWYRLGGGVSERQWRDAVSIVLVQAERLDGEYLARTAERVGLSDLLERLYKEAAGSSD
jgi:hypothetical protein